MFKALKTFELWVTQRLLLGLCACTGWCDRLSPGWQPVSVASLPVRMRLTVVFPKQRAEDMFITRLHLKRIKLHTNTAPIPLCFPLVCRQ